MAIGCVSGRAVMFVCLCLCLRLCIYCRRRVRANARVRACACGYVCWRFRFAFVLAIVGVHVHLWVFVRVNLCLHGWFVRLFGDWWLRWRAHACIVACASTRAMAIGCVSKRAIIFVRLRVCVCARACMYWCV